MRNRTGVVALLAAALGCSSGGGGGAPPRTGLDGGPDASASDGVSWPGTSGRDAVGALDDAGPRADAGQGGEIDAATGGGSADSGAPGAGGAPTTPDAGGCSGPDRDDDGVCDPDDHCVGAGAEDGDDDGACDDDDLCANSDDAWDRDFDGVPDGCDVCEAGSDDDLDNNGLADACDRVLWSHRFQNIDAAPYESIGVMVSARAAASPDAPIEEIAFDLPVPSEGFEIEEADVDDLVGALSGSGKLIAVTIERDSEPASHFTEASPVMPGAYWSRLAVRGSVVANVSDFTVELRGYLP